MIKYFKNSKYYAIFLAMIQVICLFIILFYYHNTNYCSEISIKSNSYTEVLLVTPAYNKFVEKIKPNEEKIIHKRPLKSISYKDNVDVRFETNSVKIIDIINFLNSKGLFVLWIVFTFASLVGLLLCSKNKIKRIFFLIKFKIYRFLISGKEYNSDNKIIISKFNLILFYILILFWVISTFYIIGKNPIGQSESGKWRALVAAEMKISGNYIVPTLNGNFYYNKPPLFNYCLIPFVDSQTNLELKLRSISTVSTILLLIAVFFISRKQFDKSKSLWIVLIFAFSNVVYFSIAQTLSLDPFFAFFCVLLFYFNFHFANIGKYKLMFLIGYSITALAFLTKGFPALYFQIVSLFSIMICFKSYKTFFSLKHLVIGLMTFVLILGAYIYMYSQYNNPILLLRSMYGDIPIKINTGIYRRLLNILVFYGKTLFGYPVLALMPILVYRKTLVKILKNRYDSYLFLIIAIGIFPFFIGDYFQQYILMFVPFIIMLIIKYLPSGLGIPKIHKLLVCGLALIFISIYCFLFKETYLPLFIIIPFFIILFYKNSIPLVLNILFFGLIVLNLVLNNEKKDNIDIKKEAKILIEKTNKKPIYIYPNDTEINYASMFYLTYYKNDIIRIADNLDNREAFYLSDKKFSDNITAIDSIFQEVHKQTPDPYGKYLIGTQLYLFKFD